MFYVLGVGFGDLRFEFGLGGSGFQRLLGLLFCSFGFVYHVLVAGFTPCSCDVWVFNCLDV